MTRGAEEPETQGPSDRTPFRTQPEGERLFVGPVERPDEYELVDMGRKGGEGIVFHARFRGTLPQPVTFAVKQLLPPPGMGAVDWPDQRLIDRWHEQLQLLYSVHHPHLVSYRALFWGWPPHPGGTCSGTPPRELRSWYLVMEWVESPSLNELVRGKAGLSPELLEVVIQVAAALEHLHSGAQTNGMALLHRDVKPGNIIVHPTRGAVLVDYGLLRVDEPDLTELPSWTGPYLAPEVHVDKTQSSKASDLWALAATAFFGITGQQPSPLNAPLMRRQLTEAVENQPGDPEAVVDAVMSVLERPPEARPASPQAWAARLKAAYPTTETPRSWARLRRHRFATVAAAILLVGAATAGGLVAASGSSKPPAAKSLGKATSSHSGSSRSSGSSESSSTSTTRASTTTAPQHSTSTTQGSSGVSSPPATGGTGASQGPALDTSQVANGQTALTLPSGSQEYVFGLIQGGAYPGQPFATGTTQSVTNADGNLSTAIAVTSSNSDSFSTQSQNYYIGGFAVSKFSSMTAKYGSNPGPGSSMTATVQFSVSQQNSLVVLLGLAGDQQCATFSNSVPGLSVDQDNQDTTVGTYVITIAHAVLAPGTYSVSYNTQFCYAGQDPNHATALVGAFVFSP